MRNEMTQEERMTLKKAADYISFYSVGICLAIYIVSDLEHKLINIPEAMAFRPEKIFYPEKYWFEHPLFPEGKSERLLAIAFMLTMPKEMIP